MMICGTMTLPYLFRIHLFGVGAKVEDSIISGLVTRQGGNQDKDGSDVQVSFPISFSQNCLSVVTELTHSHWDPGETNVWDVSATGFSVGEQDSGGFWGWYWIAVGI